MISLVRHAYDLHPPLNGGRKGLTAAPLAGKTGGLIFGRPDTPTQSFCGGRRRAIMMMSSYWRSEEHTSELQSLMRISYAVFCLTTKTKLNNNTLKHTQC